MGKKSIRQEVNSAIAGAFAKVADSMEEYVAPGSYYPAVFRAVARDLSTPIVGYCAPSEDGGDKSRVKEIQETIKERFERLDGTTTELGSNMASAARHPEAYKVYAVESDFKKMDELAEKIYEYLKKQDYLDLAMPHFCDFSDLTETSQRVLRGIVRTVLEGMEEGNADH